MAKKKSRLMCNDSDFQNLGILRNRIAVFEDGLRTNAKTGEYEWWYFDNKFPDGSSLVVIFFMNKITGIGRGFEPYVILDYVSDKNEEIHTEYHPRKKDWYLSNLMCDVRIGDCYCRGDLNEYEVYFKNDVVECKIFLKGNVPAWRPYTGRISFDEKHYFAWLPSVPEGDAKVEINYLNKGKKLNLFGTGYHDHNWGDKPMFFLMHHWYWGRAKIGDYTVISSYITSNRKHSLCETPVFMIAKDGKILADDGLSYLTYNEYDYEFNPITNKHFAKTLEYTYNDGLTKYVIKYIMKDTVEIKGMKDLATKSQIRILKLLKLDGSYQRVSGIATLDKYENGKHIEHAESPAMWEQMYFERDRLRN